MSSISLSKPSVELTSDASGSWGGCGAYTSQGYLFQLPLPESWSDIHITVKELLLIVLGVAVWGEWWQGMSVSCRCDNAAVVAIVNSGRSKMDRAMHLIRCLSFFLAWWGVSVKCRHIPGVQNGAADALSRNALPSFQHLVPEVNELPSPSRQAVRVPCARDTRLDQGGLDQHVQTFFMRGLADSTHRVYRTGQKRYSDFCSKAGLHGVTASESVVCKFVAQLATEGRKHRTQSSRTKLE